MRRTHRACLSLTLTLLLLAAATPAHFKSQASATANAATTIAADAGPRAADDNNLVGSFKVHVNVQERAVRVESRGGTHAAAVPSTGLAASFAGWDAASRVASLDVAVVNAGTEALSGPLKARVVGVSPPHAAPADAAQGWTYDAASLGGSNVLQPNQTSLPLRWNFHSPRASAFNFDVEISASAGATIPAGAGATVNGPGGTSVTVPPGSLLYDAVIDIAPAAASEVEAPLGQLEFVGAVRLTIRPVNVANTSVRPPAKPLQLSIPLPDTTTATKFIVGRQTLCDDISGPTPGIRQKLAATDTAVLDGDTIVTQADIFPGVLGGGLFVFVANHGSGYVTGTVADAGGPRKGAVVSNDTNQLVSITDAAGQYTLYINGGPFTVAAFDPARGTDGTGVNDITESGSTVHQNIFLLPLDSPTNTRDGIRNGGFERADLSGWATVGAATPVERFGPTSGGVTILPSEGKWMASINTGGGSVGGVGSGLKQKFTVPAGVSTLRFDFDFISEEFPEFVNSSFDDSFQAVITTPDGERTFAGVSVNDSGGFQLIGDCGFTGGDSTCGHTGWREGSVDLSQYAGTFDPVEVELVFSANDAGDNAYDTHVLVDNMRFSTLWVDFKVLQGGQLDEGEVPVDRARVERELVEANETLSQVGINLRLRNVTFVPDPANLVDPDITWNVECRSLMFFDCRAVLTDDMTALLSLQRSAVSTDLNVYYVNEFTSNPGAAGIAIGPDGYHDVGLLTNAGVILPHYGGGGLAHEIGHILITAQVGTELEHFAPAGNFMADGAMPPSVASREQSADINASGNPLLLP